MVYRDFRHPCCRGLIALALSLGPTPAWTEEPVVFSTWESFEADKCASLWLIKRFIDPAATFRFYPSGARIDQGIAFDTPDALFRRTHTQSTFERLLDHYAIRDPMLHELGRIIHDIEINTWERKRLPETHTIMQDLEPQFTTHADPLAMSTFCLGYFDRFYAQRRSDSSVPTNATDHR